MPMKNIEYELMQKYKNEVEQDKADEIRQKLIEKQQKLAYEKQMTEKVDDSNKKKKLSYDTVEAGNEKKYNYFLQSILPKEKELQKANQDLRTNKKFSCEINYKTRSELMKKFSDQGKSERIESELEFSDTASNVTDFRQRNFWD